VPKAAVLTPLGTILYGNKETDDTKLKGNFLQNLIIKICAE
jgi:hypothetical protein